jgi:uncharacterized protein (TIGR02466 family)
MGQPAVYPLFSAPFYVNDVGAFELPDIKDLEYTSRLPTGGSHTFLTSVDKNVLDRPDYRHIHDIVLKEINAYARDVLKVSKNVEFYVTNSWVNIYRPGDQCVPHTHNNSLISGVLYLKVSETSGDLYLYRDILSLVPFPPSLDLDTDSANIYNCKHFGHRPKVNEICLFPSVIMHSAGVNASDQERWCLPFNVFVRGNFGGMHHLNLK